MNEQIYADTETNENIYTSLKKPVVHLSSETLSDGSKAWNIHFQEGQLDCVDEIKARHAMALIAVALRQCAVGNVLHI